MIFCCQIIVSNWSTVIRQDRRVLKYRYKGAGKIASVFYTLYRILQPSHEGASIGHHLGSRRGFGVFK